MVTGTTSLFLLTVPRQCFFCGSFMLFPNLFLLCFRARLFIDALWSPAGKELTSLISCVMSYCDVVTFPLVSWVRCGASLYRFYHLRESQDIRTLLTKTQVYYKSFLRPVLEKDL